ncbi:MAG TPA: RluA family pseudouridine synthase [Thermoanaerobaculia bacterium]|nr:RluA family pseudouridine synthase [Thermoanaerobaculia bacterium]
MSEIRRSTVTAGQAGQTVAAVIRELVPGLSWSKARELVESGRVRIEGKPAADPAQRVREGERIEVGTAPAEARREPELLVHLDAEVAVVRKPAGLLTVPFERTDRDTLVSRARVAIRRLEASRGVPHNPGLRAVQRLDKETSGLVVFARTLPAQRHLQRQFTEHTALRRYLAVVHGKARDAVYDTMLVSDRGDGLRGSSRGREVRSDARQAITYVTVEARLRGATLVSCRLETGRTHQIRIHLAEAGHPLLGEMVYVRDFAGPWLPAPRLMLHATELGFVHPQTGRELRFTDPPPEDFSAVVAGLKLSTT